MSGSAPRYRRELRDGVPRAYCGSSGLRQRCVDGWRRRDRNQPDAGHWNFLWKSVPGEFSWLVRPATRSFIFEICSGMPCRACLPQHAARVAPRLPSRRAPGGVSRWRQREEIAPMAQSRTLLRLGDCRNFGGSCSYGDWPVWVVGWPEFLPKAGAERYPSADDRGGSGSGGKGLARGVFLRPVPGQQLVELRGGVIGDARQHIGEPGAWIDVVQFGRGNER